MYIPEFVCGFIAGIIVEFVALTVIALISIKKRK